MCFPPDSVAPECGSRGCSALQSPLPCPISTTIGGDLADGTGNARNLGAGVLTGGPGRLGQHLLSYSQQHVPHPPPPPPHPQQSMMPNEVLLYTGHDNSQLTPQPQQVHDKIAMLGEDCQVMFSQPTPPPSQQHMVGQHTPPPQQQVVCTNERSQLVYDSPPPPYCQAQVFVTTHGGDLSASLPYTVVTSAPSLPPFATTHFTLRQPYQVEQQHHIQQYSPQQGT